MIQSPDEKTYVEIPFIEQLKAMGGSRYGSLNYKFLKYIEMIIKYDTSACKINS
ncbi:MAG: hypothetical protein KKD12_00110 [Proteobacteria bacterium]|nr:hypothetical protein [Pseudomonadota bacterium]MBU4504696.1 hypothetical protein [Pseudomonadota bacterium]MCG2830091.1 hypothetical protein [Desulfobacteraceae bacterium]